MLMFKNGKLHSIAVGEQTHIARFSWITSLSFNLYVLVEMCRICGGTVINEVGQIVYDSGREYDHKIFQNNFETFQKLYGKLA